MDNVETLRIKWLSLNILLDRDNSVENQQAEDDAWDRYVEAMRDTMKIKTNIRSVRLANNRVINVGHEVTNFGRKCVVLGSPIGLGCDSDLVVQEIANGQLVPGAKWIAVVNDCA
jgi:hypothetical protein